MRNSPANSLFPKTRQHVLSATLMHPNRWWYLSELAKHCGLTPSSLQHELASLTEAGILRSKRDGNRLYYQPDPNCPFLSDLQGVIAKTIGLLEVLHELLEPYGPSIEVAFVFGSVARADERTESDIDLMVVGSLKLSELSEALVAAEDRLSRPVNASVVTVSELVRKVKNGHHFLDAVLDKEKLFVVGNNDDLERIVGKRSRRRAPSKQAGAR